MGYLLQRKIDLWLLHQVGHLLTPSLGSGVGTPKASVHHETPKGKRAAHSTRPRMAVGSQVERGAADSDGRLHR